MARRSFSPAGLSFSRTGRRSSRTSDWSEGYFATTYTAVPAASAVLLISTSAAQFGGLTPATLIRSRGWFSFRSDQNDLTEFQIGAVGMAIVQERARAAGIASIPRPVSEMTSDEFFYIRGFSEVFTHNTSVGFDSIGASGFEVDSKAMRKITDIEALVVTVEWRQYRQPWRAPVQWPSQLHLSETRSGRSDHS